VIFRKLSIATKLYAIFALLTTMTLALSVVAVVSARHHAALTDAFESSNAGSLNVERVSAIIYAVLAEQRAIYVADDRAAAAPHVKEILRLNDKLGAVMSNWQASVQASEAAHFSDFAVRLVMFQEFPAELARIAGEAAPKDARQWAEANDPDDLRKALTDDLTKLGATYANNANRVYARIDDGIAETALVTSVIAGIGVLLAILGAAVIARQVARPLKIISAFTEKVAAGETSATVPFAERADEIGALARSVVVFQQAMARNVDLNRTVVEDAQTRARRQEITSTEIVRFSAEVEATLAELGRISDQMLGASSEFAAAADDAAAKTTAATNAAAEASANVRDIASAADELTVSVNEIDRQVAQSNAIAGKAVSEAERTNLAVTELDEAASRIGDVVRLITDIAEQTNLLALNATIEAARAGEAGRGFAVVAGEVKALAGQTGRATGEIGAQIAGMQRATKRSIEALGAIQRTIREIGEISGAIAAAVTEQGAATQEIARGVETAAQRTAESADQVSLVSNAADATRTSAVGVKHIADDLGHVAGRIRSQVDQFFERLSA
jgi:methyl-accepting chemotaxis protein